MTLTLQERVIKARTTIMRDKRFIAIAGIMMIGKWEICDKTRTAVTNGRDVKYGSKFIEGLTDKQLMFLILHEYYHVMLMQLSMWKHLWKEDAQTANMAADFVVNLLLDKLAGSRADGFIEFIDGGCLDYQYDNLDTGDVYRKLKQQGNGGGGGGGKGEPLDEHDTSGEDMPEISQEEMEILKEQIDTVVRQAAQVAGKLGASMDRSITDLLEVAVPWQDQLTDFVKTTAQGNDLSTWRRPNRRWMTQGVYMPTRYTEAVKRITIGVDTSGSIGTDQLRRALTEIKGACEYAHPEFVDLIYWDYDVAGHETYEASNLDSLVNATKPKGGGGTRVGSMRQYMERNNIKPECIIIFTDGYVEADWGSNNWPAPVMWCISTKGIKAPFGKSLYVPVE